MYEYLLGLLAFFRVYRDARLFFLRRSKPAHSGVMRGAEPFFRKRGKTGILLLHGFTNSPHDMKQLGTYLAARGITVYCPLLKYHGTSPEDLVKGTLPEWNRQVEQEMEFLKKHCRKIFIAGTSFGGNLALLYAARHDIDGVITYGTPIFWKREKLYKSLYTIMQNFKIFKDKDYNKVEKDRKRLHLMTNDRVHYMKVPLPTLSHVIASANKCKKALKKITSPMLAMQSTTDYMVDNRTLPYIDDNISARQKKMAWVNDEYHVLPISEKKLFVFRETYKFIKGSFSEGNNRPGNQVIQERHKQQLVRID